MPKETVQYPRTDFNSGTEITVHWGKESSHVQLHVQRHVWKREVDSTCVEHDWQGLPVPNANADEAVEVFTDVLSRSEINRLIRTLRRARDQAYGADE